MNIKSVLLIALSLFLLPSCDDNQSLPKVTQLQSSVSTEDFALAAIGGLIKNGMADPTALESEINKAGDDNPYTRVDINNDGKRDIILVKEVIPHEKLEFIAHPGDGLEDQSIATASFTIVNGNVDYNANYTSYVNGYDHPRHLYHDSFARDLAFMMWMSSISRPVYYGVPSRYSYYRSVPRSTFTSSQTTTFQRTKINPTPVATNPSSFNKSSFVSKATPPKATPNFNSATPKATPAFRPNNNSNVQKSAFDNKPSYKPSTPVKSSSSSSSRSFSSSRSRGR
jgi:hypothetical protein